VIGHAIIVVVDSSQSGNAVKIVHKKLVRKRIQVEFSSEVGHY